MVRCSVCSTTNPDDSKFCNGCGSRLAAATSTSITEERKVITALAKPALKRSQDIFQRLHAAPSLAVIDALLVQAHNSPESR